MWARQHFRAYLEGQEFQLLTDNNALYYILRQTNPRGGIARWVTFLNQFTYTVRHVPDSKNVVPDLLIHQDYEATHTDADEAIEAFSDLGANKAVNEADQSGSCLQTKVQIDPCLQVMLYQPSKLVRDLKHMGATFGTPFTTVWREIKVKASTMVNAHRDRLHPVLTQKAQENMAEIDLRRGNVRQEQSCDLECSLKIKYLTPGMLPQRDRVARSILLRQEDYIMIDSLLYHIFTPIG